MSKLFVLLIFSMCVKQVYAQTENAAYKKSVLQFQHIFNGGKYDSLFLMFSQEFKKELPLDKIINLLSATKSVAGEMLSATFETFESSYAAYKAAFERRQYSLYLSLDDTKHINGFLLESYVPNNLPKLKRNITSMILPFTGTWTVLWGGDTKEQNYHIEVPVQKNAFDFIITDSAGNAFRTDVKTNEDYYAFGKDIISVSDAEVVLVVDGVKDNIPGSVNPMFVTGNTVVLKTTNNEYAVYAHFKQHSIIVKEGQLVKQGELLGKCGNSGNSNQPHLHFHIQNVEDMNLATGAKVYFKNIFVNGIKKAEHSPVRDERVVNGENVGQ